MAHADYMRVYKLIESKQNILMSHKSCNCRKAEDIPDLNNLIIPGKRKSELKQIETVISPAIELFTGMKDRIMMRQNHRCYQCGKTLSRPEDGILRRIRSDKQRIESNGCVVCSRCNEKYEEFGGTAASRNPQRPAE